MNVKLVFTLGEGFGERDAKDNLNLGGMLRVSPGIIRTIEPSRVR
jgi:hypothetical protein